MIKLNVTVVSLALVLSSCTGVRIGSNQAKGVDFKKYKTFAWSKPSDPTYESRKGGMAYANLILQLANDELKKRGFIPDTLNPDAVFIFDTRLEQEMSYSRGEPATQGYGYIGFGYNVGYYSPATSTHASQKEYEVGNLYIDMFDTKTKVPLWGGWATAKLSAKSDPEKIVRTAVKSIFNRLNVPRK